LTALKKSAVLRSIESLTAELDTMK
jgi:hypothetical protein